MLFWQDVVLTVPPYMYADGEPSDVPLDWSGLSCFSLAIQVAICSPGADGRRKGPITRMARTTSKFSRFQPAGLQGKGMMGAGGCIGGCGRGG